MSDPTPRPWSVTEFDEVVIVGAGGHVGVAATGPDPMCREHYRGGPIGGRYFAPP
jgi:hypothetical protein